MQQYRTCKLYQYTMKKKKYRANKKWEYGTDR